ncbi:hypothetical protein GCM10009634_48310 [Saccharothrix xinjiangensis]
MGGSLTAPGNITPSADANAWHEPLAAAITLDPDLVTYRHLAVGVELTADADTFLTRLLTALS